MKKGANFLRYATRTILLILGILVFFFALFSGADSQEGFVSGIINNSPNALPGLGLLILTAIAWRYELIGGILTTAFGLFLVYFFNFGGNNFFPVTFIATILITVLGLFFIASWLIRRNLNQLHEGNLG
jgi:ABC-type antimicrobial peptide transport system permease subunit